MISLLLRPQILASLQDAGTYSQTGTIVMKAHEATKARTLVKNHKYPEILRVNWRFKFSHLRHLPPVGQL